MFGQVVAGEQRQHGLSQFVGVPAVDSVRGAPAVGFPTVPEGKARLRAMVTATHKRADLDRACNIIAEVGRGI